MMRTTRLGEELAEMWPERRAQLVREAEGAVARRQQQIAEAEKFGKPTRHMRNALDTETRYLEWARGTGENEHG